MTGAQGTVRSSNRAGMGRARTRNAAGRAGTAMRRAARTRATGSRCACGGGMLCRENGREEQESCDDKTGEPHKSTSNRELAGHIVVVLLRRTASVPTVTASNANIMAV